MTAIYTLIGVIAGALLTLAYTRNQRHDLINTIDTQADEIDSLEAQIDFLENELQIAVSISKRLNEALAEKFAGVYGAYPFRQPETHQPEVINEPLNDERVTYQVGNKFYFIHPELAAALEAEREQHHAKRQHNQTA